MKPKLTLCLALVLGGSLFGCASANFNVMPDKQKLTDNHRIVAEVTCVEAKPTQYKTFRDQYLRIGAMPPHVRWTVTFQVNKILKGQFAGQSVTLVDARIAGNPYFRFWFEAGKIYTVGFNSVSDNQVNGFAVFGHEPDSMITDTTAARIQKQVESLPQSQTGSFRVVPIEKAPIGKNSSYESWLDHNPAPLAVRRFEFIPATTKISFYVMFVFADSTDHARNLLLRSEGTVQGMGKTSRNYGADELEIYDDWLAGRWQQTVVIVYADSIMPTITQKEWSSVMRIIESVTRERN